MIWGKVAGSLLRAWVATLLIWALAAGACPLCPEGSQGAHECCRRPETTSCGHTQTPEPDKRPCPGGHPLFADYGKAQKAPEDGTAACLDGTHSTVGQTAQPRMSGDVIHPVLSPDHSPPPRFLLNSILRI
jgi:hypothetical protein